MFVGWIYPGVIDTLHRVLRWKEDVVFPVTHRQQEDHCPPHTVRNVTTHAGTRLRALFTDGLYVYVCMYVHMPNTCRQEVTYSSTEVERACLRA